MPDARCPRCEVRGAGRHGRNRPHLSPLTEPRPKAPQSQTHPPRQTPVAPHTRRHSERASPRQQPSAKLSRSHRPAHPAYPNIAAKRSTGRLPPGSEALGATPWTQTPARATLPDESLGNHPPAPPFRGVSRETTQPRAASYRTSSSLCRTCLAIARHAVNPGDSMPNKFTRPLTPCTPAPSIRKSAAA